jgi:branched-chain amino acid transport system substrate-binding protein
MRTRRWTAAAAIATVMLAAGCGVVESDPAPDIVLIGVDLELTGHGEALGSVYLQALELRVEQVNHQGLLGEGRQLELEVRDNRSDPATSALNVADLASNPDTVAIITGGCSACAAASAEAVAIHGVPMISLAAADEVAAPTDEPRYVFKLSPNADHNASALIAQLAREGITTIGMIATTEAYGDEGVARLEEAASRADIDVSLTVRVNQDSGETGLAEAASEIVSYEEPPDVPFQTGAEAGSEPSPEAVVLWLPAPLAGEFARELRSAGYEGPLFLDASAADGLFLSRPTASALEGATLIFTETLVMDAVLATSPAKTARKTWFNTYSARYGTYHAFSSFAADAVQVIVEAINRRDTTDRDEIRAVLEQTQLDGMTGPLRITPENHSGLTARALVPLVASSGRWQPAT